MSDRNSIAAIQENEKDGQSSVQSSPNKDASLVMPAKSGKVKKIFSCYACRRRKLKCDRMDPCSACAGRGEGHLCTWQDGQRPDQSNKGNLDQLKTLVGNLADEMRQLRAVNSRLVDSVKDEEAIKVGEKRKSPDQLEDSDSDPDGKAAYHDQASYQVWLMSKLPETGLLASLMVEFIRRCLPTCVFINLEDILSSLEKIELIRKGIAEGDTGIGATFPTPLLQMKCALVLACSSLSLLHIDAVTAERMQLAEDGIESMARCYWNRTRRLISEVSATINDIHQEGGGPLSNDTNTNIGDRVISHDILAAEIGMADASQAKNLLLLRIVSIKLILLMAARSFATPDEFLKVHLDTIASSVDASLDMPFSYRSVPSELEALHWRLWTSLRLIDWTAQATYHHGSYYLQSDYSASRSACSSPASGSDDFPVEADDFDSKHRFERFRQARHYLRHAISVARLSCRVKHCVEKEGPVSAIEAEALCEELDGLEDQLNFYQIVSHSLIIDDSFKSKLASLLWAASHYNMENGSPWPVKNPVDLQTSLSIQSASLSLELSLIRFKLFRHEFFNIMRSPSSWGHQRIVCADACLDACIMVLSHCRSICIDQLSNASARSGVIRDPIRPHRRVPNTFRRVLQPASSAALVGQIILLTARYRPAMAGNSGLDLHLDRTSGEGEWLPYYSSCKVGDEDGADAGRLAKEKVNILQWHIKAVLSELQFLDSSSRLANSRLKLHMRCM